MERSDARKRRTEATDTALDDSIRRIVRDAMADAWDQGWQTAIAHPYDTPNPYRPEENP